MTSRYGQLIRLRPEFEERYIILHRHVFPAVLEQIRRSHIHNYSIYLDRPILFAYFEHTGSDFAGDMEAMAADPVTRDWWKLTDPMQEPLPDRRPGDWWTRLDEVFDAGREQPPSPQRQALTADLPKGCEQALKDRFAQVRQNSSRLLSRFHIQRCSVFVHGPRLYFYLEDQGDPAGTSVRAVEFVRALVPQSLVKDRPAPVELLRPITEVFHTD